MLSFNYKNLLHCGKRAKPFLCVVLVCIYTFLISPQFTESTSNAIKFFGLVLQLCGLLTIAYGIRETRKVFGKPSYSKITLNWFSQFISTFKPVKTEHCSVDMTLPGLKIEASGYGVEVAEKNASPERKIEILEKNLATAMNRITTLHQNTTSKISDVNKNISNIHSQLSTRQEEINKLLEESLVGGINIEAMGLAWLTFGIIAATFPDELAKFF